MKTGLANMAYGVIIALVGALITGVTYSMVSGSGGTYVVAYGAFIVGAWRFLLGLFQVLRGAVSGQDAGSTLASPPALRPAGSTAPLASPPGPVVVEVPSGALHGIGWVLIADAAFRAFGLGSLLWRIRIPFAELFTNVPFLVLSIVLPVVFILGGVAAGVLLLRNLPTAIPFGIAFCAASLLFQAYGLWRLLSLPVYRVPWLSWAIVFAHVAVYIVSLIVLLRSSDRRGLAGRPLGGQSDIHVSPGTRT